MNDAIPGIGTPRPESILADLESLLLELRSLNAQAREKAVIRLGELQEARAYTALLGRLTNDSDPSVRAAAATALYQFGNPLTWDVFADRLIQEQTIKSGSYSSQTEYIEPAPIVRTKLAELFGLCDDPKYAEVLAKALNDRESTVRKRASLSLGQLKNASIIPRLLAGLSAGNTTYEDAHVDALVAMGPMVIEEVISSSTAYKSDVVSNMNSSFFKKRSAVLRGIGSPAIPNIRNHFGNKKEIGIRLITVGALRDIKDDPQATELLCQACLDEIDSRIRKFATEGLRARPVGQIFGTLISILEKDPVEDLRALAAMILGELKEPKAVDPLCQVIEIDKSLMVRKQAISALQAIGDSRAIPTLGTALMDSSDTEIRKLAAQAIGSFRSSQGVDYLCAALGNDIDFQVKEISLQGLLDIEDPMMMNCMRNVLLEGNARQWNLVLGALTLPKLQDCLLSLIKPTSPEDLRLWIIEKINQNLPGNPSVLTVYTSALGSDPSPKVRIAIIQGLGAYKNPANVDRLIYHLRRDQDREVRAACAYSLGRLGDRRALAELRSAARESDQRVREAAEHAVKQIERGY